MNIFSNFGHRSPEPENVNEKVWKRSRAILGDKSWQALSYSARDTYLNKVKATVKETSSSQSGTMIDQLPAPALEELVNAGLVRIEPGMGKRSAKVLPMPKTYDFSARVRALYRFQVLGSKRLEDLAKFVRYAFVSQGEPLIALVLHRVEINEFPRLEEGLSNYVVSRHWPEWVEKLIGTKAIRPLIEALTQAKAPVPIDQVPKLIPSIKPAEVAQALDDLIAHLVVFEDVDPKTFQLVVGLLPMVRDRLAQSNRPGIRPPLIVCPNPREFGPSGGMFVNDLRVFLLEVAGESPRLRQDMAIFQNELPRFEAALPLWPEWLSDFYETSGERRVVETYGRARQFQLVEFETEDKRVSLNLSGKGRKWLASGLEQQYGTIYSSFRSSENQHNYNDSRFFGIGLNASVARPGQTTHYYYYQDLTPENRVAQRRSIEKSLAQLPVGVFHVWQSVVDHLVFETENPLLGGRDPATVTIFLDQRPVPKLLEKQEEAGKRVLDVFLRLRLLPYDAFRAAIDEKGRLCVARLARYDGYFGREYVPDPSEVGAKTRVIVQPDFSLIVIGLDPAPAAELAPFCERSRGQLGEGAITYRITRESITRAASQGLSGPAIIQRLKKHASVDVPANVLKEVEEWAGWVQLVNVRPVMVVRCSRPETVARVVAALGKKAERLNDHYVALNGPRLTPGEREKLQAQGILITKDEIVIDDVLSPPALDNPAPDPAPSPKRGRPRKAK